MASDSNENKRTSRIPALRELCPNLLRGSSQPDGLKLSGKQRVGRLLGLLGRAGGGKNQAPAEGKEVVGDVKTGDASSGFAQELQSCKEENQSLKARLAEYEKLCFSLDQVFDHFSGLPEAGLAGKASSSAEIREDIATVRAEDGESEALLGLFVDNIILRSKQTLQEERIQALVSAAPAMEKVKPKEHLSSVHSTPPPSPQSLAVDADSHLHCRTTAGQLCLVNGSDSITMPLGARSITNVSTSTSFETERSQSLLVGTVTSIELACEMVEAATNTSLVAEDKEETPIGQTERLEGALMTNELLQTSVEDYQARVASLETINTSLHQELQAKDSRLVSMGQELADIIRQFQAVEPKSEAMQYKELYHKSLQHCAALQSQLESFRALSGKMQRIEQLKEVALAYLAENKALVQQKDSDLQSKKQAWRAKLEVSETRQAELSKECEHLRVSCRELGAENRALAASYSKLLAHHSIAKAVQTLQAEEIGELEARNGFQETEIARLKKKMSKFASCLQHSQQEHQECVEFLGAERDSLLESTAELESQVAALQHSLRKKEAALDAAEAQMKSAEVCMQEERSQVRDLILTHSSELGQLRGCIKEVCVLFSGLLGSRRELVMMPQTEATSLDQLESAELMVHLRSLSGELQKLVSSQRNGSQPSDVTISVEQFSFPGAHSTEEGGGRHSPTSLEPSLRAVSCQECQRLQRALDTALRALNDRSCARYGDLLREKFSLKQQMQELSKELNQGQADVQKLTTYIQRYQAKSTEKIDVLKKNLSKVDTEVTELDRLIDQIREVLHANIVHVKKCAPLLELLKDLDGCEAPSEY